MQTVTVFRVPAGRPRCVPGVSWRPWQAVAATRRPGREGYVGKTSQVVTKSRLPSKVREEEARETPDLATKIPGTSHLKALGGPISRPDNALRVFGAL